jgi:predicted nucleotide-binding protein
MARLAKRSVAEPAAPTVAPHVGITLLTRQIEKGNKLLQEESVSEAEYNAWITLSEEVVIKSFGRESDKHYGFLNAGPRPVVTVGDQSPSWYESRRRQRLAAKVSQLGALISVLELELEVELAPSNQRSELAVLPSASNNSDVFIVHGHESQLRNTMARFVEKLGLNPVILHEQPNKGRTIIEKFTDHADVGFAVVLLTPDDRGGPARSPYEEQNLRARQNVIFELGFFLGKLGRHRVCALYREDVEIPSDYAGVVFVAFDEAGAWRFSLARELKSAGFDIDMNRVL